ncbi:ankyrin repeats (3 copies) domain-containing protein [Phthorimaea operculella]|nr:ankyrin repeats (3 copies) domain-containing protein [Phthorimaea operculella]
MEVDQEVTPVTTKKKGVANELPNEGPSPKHEGKKADAEDPKPRIVLTFRSEKAGAKTSTMKIVPTEEKHEEISPRRSNRTRAAKYDSDEEIEHPITPKKEKQTSENEEASDSSHTAVKRSTRRRSKEFDNVIANAIARKEKSYNETPTPSRPSRRIKPTAKVLANEELRIGFESQNNARLGVQDKSPEEGVRTRRSIRGRQTVHEEPKIEIKQEDAKVKEDVGMEVKDEMEEEEDPSQVMKLKHLCELGLQAIKPEDIKDEESESTSQDAMDPGESTSQEAIELDDDTADEEIDDDSEVISKLLEADAESVSDSDDEFLCSGENAGRTRRSTRSTRQHSSFKNDSGRSSPVHGDDDHGAPLRRSSRKRRTISPTLAEVIGYDVPHNHSKKLRSTATPEADGEEISEPAPGEEGSEAACPPDESAIVATCYCETPSNVYAAPSELTEPVFCQAIELVDGVRVGCSHGAMKQPDGSYAAMRRAGPRAPYFLACKLHTAQLAKHMCCPACGLFCSQGYFYQCSLGHFFHLECGLPYNMVKPPPGCPHCGVRSYRWTPANTNCHKVKLQMHCSNKRIFLPEQREQCTPAYAGFTTLKESQLDTGPVIPEDLLPSTPIDLKRLCEKPDMEEDPTDAAEALCDAILAGEDVDSLIPKIIAGAGLNIPLPSLGGGTVLHAAAKRGHLSAVHLLHTAGADLNCMAASKTPLMVAILVRGTVLHAAAKRGHLSAVHLLHTAGADLNCMAASKTPLMVAILALLDKTEIKSPKKNKTTIDIVKDEDGEQVKEVIEDGKESDVEEVKSVDSRPDEEQLLKVIRYLIAAGCDVNLPGPDGMTALHMAAQYGGTDVCKIILNNTDANVDARDQGGWTPLVWAAENLHADTVSEVCKIILNNTDANVDARDQGGWTPLVWAAENLHADTVRSVLIL